MRIVIALGQCAVAADRVKLLAPYQVNSALVVRMVKDLRIGARAAAAESLVTPRWAITRRPATRHAETHMTES